MFNIISLKAECLTEFNYPSFLREGFAGSADRCQRDPDVFYVPAPPPPIGISKQKTALLHWSIESFKYLQGAVMTE